MANHDVDNLMKRIALGDLTALETLYGEMSRPVYFFALRLLGDPDAAEDVMQDTFVSVMRNSGSYKSDGKGKSWIFTIAKHKAADELRRKKAEPLEDAPESAAAAPDFSEKSDEKISALKMLDILDKKERDIVMLRLLGEMTLTQVAKELDMPKGTVFWSYNNAVKKLRNHFKGGENDD